MKHQKKVRSLGRVRRQRLALLRGLARSLILAGKIRTTEARAKELRPFIERIISRSKVDSLPSRRIIAARLGTSEDKVLKHLLEMIAPKYKERSGGYTRIIKAGRTAAGRDEAIIEFV